MALNLSMPGQEELKPRITVFGVGGAGGNAVNNMITKQLEGVDRNSCRGSRRWRARGHPPRRSPPGSAAWGPACARRDPSRCGISWPRGQWQKPNSVSWSSNPPLLSLRVPRYLHEPGPSATSRAPTPCPIGRKRTRAGARVSHNPGVTAPRAAQMPRPLPLFSRAPPGYTMARRGEF